MEYTRFFSDDVIQRVLEDLFSYAGNPWKYACSAELDHGLLDVIAKVIVPYELWCSCADSMGIICTDGRNNKGCVDYMTTRKPKP